MERHLPSLDLATFHPLTVAATTVHAGGDKK